MGRYHASSGAGSLSRCKVNALSPNVLGAAHARTACRARPYGCNWHTYCDLHIRQLQQPVILPALDNGMWFSRKVVCG
jgi:hypothetical protein